MSSSGPMTLPALRCRMGDWRYYVTAMPLHELADRIRPSREIYEVRGMEDMVQRELADRVGSIVSYLRRQEERLFNAIIVGLHEGEPAWYPIEVRESAVVGQPDIDPTAVNSLGLIRLSGSEKLFAIDGQHRVEAIKQALDDQGDLRNEQLPVIIVAHRTDQRGRQRTRRLFSTLNREARPVSKGEIIALDEDDGFAITARRIVREYEGLNPGFSIDTSAKSLVFFGKTSDIQRANTSSITSILALYDLIELIELPRLRRRPGAKASLTKFRPSDEVLDGIYTRHVEFWQALRFSVPELAQVIGSNPDRELAARYRRSDGGHLLFRPAGQKAFASAARILVDRGSTLDEAVATLSQDVMQLEQRPWRGVLWDPGRRRMILSNAKLAENLLLHMANQRPNPDGYDLLARYRGATGNEEASLSDIPRQSG